jgi:carboxylesterase
LSFLRAALPGLRIIQNVIKKLPKPPPLDFHNEQAAKEHLTYSMFPTRGIIETDKLLDQMRRALPQLSMPVLVIHSLTDRGVPIDNANKITHALGSNNVETLFVEESGHVVLLDPERERAADAIVRFIRMNTEQNA